MINNNFGSAGKMLRPLLRARPGKLPAAYFLIFAGMFIMAGCLQPARLDLPSYSLKDLKIDSGVARKEELKRHKDYVGEVVKVSPKNGSSWEEWSRPVYRDLNDYSGQYAVTISMSVWVYPPDSRPRTEPANIGWTIQNGDRGYRQFGGDPVDVPTGKWVDILFSQTIDIAESGERSVFMDGNNEHQGLVDLTLYIRHFKVTMEELPETETGTETEPEAKPGAETEPEAKPETETENKAGEEPIAVIKEAPGKYFALTFDVIPSGATTALLDKLDKLGVKASFFLLGMGIDALHPDLDSNLGENQRAAVKMERQAIVKRLFRDGHDIGNNSYTHNYLGGGKLDGMDGIDPHQEDDYIPFLEGYSVTDYPLSEAAIRRELEDTQNAIQKAVYGEYGYMYYPMVSKFFRIPFCSDERYIVNLSNVAASMGLPIIYGLVSKDYIPALSAEEIADNIYKQCAPWGISINNDPYEGSRILEALDIIVPKLKAEGYELVTLSGMAEKRGNPLGPGKVYYSLDPELP